MDAAGNAHEFTVSELSSALKRSIEDQFGNVRLRGEISGWKVPASGHAYFALKDDAALIDAVMKAKPAASKGVYLKKIAISTTMGPGVRIDPATVASTAAA